jgi:hypothetical protein
MCGYLSLEHKVLTYVEYRAVSGVFQTIPDPPPPSPPSECVPSRTKGGGGVHTRRAVGGEVNILEDARHSSVLYICKYFVF